MTPPRLQPLLHPLLRGLVFLSILEAVFGRILPLAEPAIPESLRVWIAPALHAGEFVFVPAFAIAAASVAALGVGLFRRACWPTGLNAFIATGLLSLTLMGLAAMSFAGGPFLATGFTLLSLVVFYAVAMHAFASEPSAAVRAVCVTYGAALTCSAIGQVIHFFPAKLVVGWASSLEAGEFLLLAAGVAGFIAWGDLRGDGPGRRQRLISALTGIPAAILYLVTRLPASTPGNEPSAGFIAAVTMEAGVLFLGVSTATGLMLDPSSHTKGLGLLLLLLAGFPLTIAYAHLLMVLGSALLFMPATTGDPLTSPRRDAPGR